MKAISTAQCSSVISLLNEEYSLYQIQDETGLIKFTVERISKEVLGDKGTCPGGHPFKLSSCDQHSIIQQIRSERLDNAVQVTQFINFTITTPITFQTVRNVLKESGFYSATKKKVPMLKKTHRQKKLEFAHYHENWTVEDFKRVLWSDRTKINQMERCMHGRREENQYLTEQLLQQQSMEGKITSWYGVVWGGMGWEVDRG